MQKRNILIGAVVIVLALVGGGLYLFFDNDAPDEVSIDSAVAGVERSNDETGSSGGSDGDADSSDDGDESDADGSDDDATSPLTHATGTWSIDSDSGDFDFEEATGTFVGFRIKEELASIGSTTAVGRTGDVTGSIEIANGTLQAADIEVDMTTITTNESRRDSRVQQALETDEFPNATFSLTAPVDLGDDPLNGELITGTASGDLTIHGVTKPMEFEIEAQLVEDTAVVVGSIDVVFSDFAVEVPSSQIVLSVEDHGVLELQMLFKKN